MGDVVLLLYYLPIYFQSIRGVSALESGVDNLPIVISIGIFCVIGGLTVAKTGHATPTMFVGAALATVGIGLLYTLDLDTSTGKWIGYQVLVGSSMAFSVQNALNIAQANVGPEDIAAVVASVYCMYGVFYLRICRRELTHIFIVFQTVGGAFTTSVGQSAFFNQLLAKLSSTRSDIDPALVIATGATELRHVFTPDQLPDVILAYMHGLKAVFAVGIGMAGFACLNTAIIPWNRLPTHAPNPPKDDVSTSA